MADNKGLAQRWEDYRPSKTALAWSCAGSVVVALVVGFTWGGWVTGGTAREMASDAARTAQAEMAAAVCVHQFTQANDARAQLVSLKDLSSYRRGRFVEDGGWATMPGSDKPVRNAGGLCADQLVNLQLPEIAAEAEATPISQ